MNNRFESGAEATIESEIEIDTEVENGLELESQFAATALAPHPS